VQVQAVAVLYTHFSSQLAHNHPSTHTRDAVLLLPGCCDPFNEKALRASRGAALRLPLVEASWEELTSIAADANLLLLAAEPEEGTDGSSSSSSSSSKQQQDQQQLGKPGVCLVLGSEGQGLSSTALQLCHPVTIPMVGLMESLNVSIAGGILMFMLSEGREQLVERVNGLLQR